MPPLVDEHGYPHGGYDYPHAPPPPNHRHGGPDGDPGLHAQAYPPSHPHSSYTPAAAPAPAHLLQNNGSRQSSHELRRSSTTDRPPWDSGGVVAGVATSAPSAAISEPGKPHDPPRPAERSPLLSQRIGSEGSMGAQLYPSARGGSSRQSLPMHASQPSPSQYSSHPRPEPSQPPEPHSYPSYPSKASKGGNESLAPPSIPSTPASPMSPPGPIEFSSAAPEPPPSHPPGTPPSTKPSAAASRRSSSRRKGPSTRASSLTLTASTKSSRLRAQLARQGSSKASVAEGGEEAPSGAKLSTGAAKTRPESTASKPHEPGSIPSAGGFVTGSAPAPAPPPPSPPPAGRCEDGDAADFYIPSPSASPKASLSKPPPPPTTPASKSFPSKPAPTPVTPAPTGAEDGDGDAPEEDDEVIEIEDGAASNGTAPVSPAAAGVGGLQWEGDDDWCTPVKSTRPRRKRGYSAGAGNQSRHYLSGNIRSLAGMVECEGWRPSGSPYRRPTPPPLDDGHPTAAAVVQPSSLWAHPRSPSPGREEAATYEDADPAGMPTEGGEKDSRKRPLLGPKGYYDPRDDAAVDEPPRVDNKDSMWSPQPAQRNPWDHKNLENQDGRHTDVTGGVRKTRRGVVTRDHPSQHIQHNVFTHKGPDPPVWSPATRYSTRYSSHRADFIASPPKQLDPCGLDGARRKAVSPHSGRGRNAPHARRPTPDGPPFPPPPGLKGARRTHFSHHNQETDTLHRTASDATVGPE
eukprot:TRINITY_DN32466_c0_g1_i1.p1 TRINITY_DN32466_c0_g1~~TRINITY_DN32466_c0_g1_i1.p1  ORF type:complete len:840 (+),score=180.34 TRINITY_DN32466_c0_g1_i1:289-2520(+)